MSEPWGGASSREEMALELARRLLAPGHRVQTLRRRFDPSSAPPDFDIFVGQLPPDFPADIPIPAGARIIGSHIGGIPVFPTRVVLDVDMGPKSALTFYRE